MALQATINDVRALMGKEGWDIQKDQRFTCRRFVCVAPDGSKTPIRFTPTSGEMLAEVKKLGSEKFTQKHAAAGDDGSGAPLTKNGGRQARSTGRGRVSRTVFDAGALAQKSSASASRFSQAPEAPADEADGYVADSKSSDDSRVDANTVVKNSDAEPIDFGIKIPKSHKGYYFPRFIENVNMRLARGRNIFLTGPGGCGKTELVQALGNLMGVRVVRVNFHIGTTEQHLIGKSIASNGSTGFVYGVLSLAMLNGWWVVFDEIDYAMPEHMAVLQPVLEGNPLVVTQNKGETILPHPNFRMFATANTKGRGDETQGYTGTNFLNMAFLDRWSIFEMDYSDQEPNICAEYLHDGKLILQLVQYFDLLRKASYGGELSNAIFTTRRMIHVCDALEAGESLQEALHYEIWSRYDKHEVDVMKECAADVWDRDTYLTGKWKVGDAHKDAAAATANS